MIAIVGAIAALGTVGFVVPGPEGESAAPYSPPPVAASAAPYDAAPYDAAPGAEPAAPQPQAADRAAEAAALEAPVVAAALESVVPTAEGVAGAVERGIAPGAAEGGSVVRTLTGSASYYADMFEGRTTASGVPFHQARMWAAHKSLPFGTRLRVTNLANGKTVEVEVVDRGPFAHGRVLDLSKAAARRLDFIRAGHTRVRIEVLAKP